MTDLGPFTENVPFAWDAASSLKHSFVRAANELEAQIGQRTSYAEDAKRDWRGSYAEEFESEHMAAIRRDAHSLAAACRTCATMLEELGDRARQEQERRELARAWETRHKAWEREQASRDGLLGAVKGVADDLFGDGEPKPPDLPEIRPHPHVPDKPAIGGRG
jgi:hypothetical protein